MFTIHVRLVSRLNVNGAIPLLLIFAVTACTGRFYFYHLPHNSPEVVAENDEKLQPGLL